MDSYVTGESCNFRTVDKSEGEIVCGCLQIGSKSKAIENCYGLLFGLKPVT